MKNFMIFLSVAVVLVFASLDAKERLKELDSVTLKTPAQVEIKQNNFNKSEKDSIGNFNKKEHKNNNLPQNKQSKPLTKK